LLPTPRWMKGVKCAASSLHAFREYSILSKTANGIAYTICEALQSTQPKKISELERDLPSFRVNFAEKPSEYKELAKRPERWLARWDCCDSGCAEATFQS